MKTLFRISLLAICGFVGTAFADDFKSVVIAGDNGATSTPLPRVHNGQFMVIRNFTQDFSASFTGGVVTVTKPPGGTSVTVLNAAILDPNNSPEFINTVIIAGPADVSVTCGASAGFNCFISFKKDNN